MPTFSLALSSCSDTPSLATGQPPVCPALLFLAAIRKGGYSGESTRAVQQSSPSRQWCKSIANLPTSHATQHCTQTSACTLVHSAWCVDGWEEKRRSSERSRSSRSRRRSRSRSRSRRRMIIDNRLVGALALFPAPPTTAKSTQVRPQPGKWRGHQHCEYTHVSLYAVKEAARCRSTQRASAQIRQRKKIRRGDRPSQQQQQWALPALTTGASLSLYLAAHANALQTSPSSSSVGSTAIFGAENLSNHEAVLTGLEIHSNGVLGDT